MKLCDFLKAHNIRRDKLNEYFGELFNVNDFLFNLSVKQFVEMCVPNSDVNILIALGG